METKLQSQQMQYPRFIQNKPCGIDKLDGGSQERLAKTIARHFRQNDSLNDDNALPRIIGIEGIWGSGKSNVVKMLEKELSDNYYFFEYDALKNTLPQISLHTLPCANISESLFSSVIVFSKLVESFATLISFSS